LAEGHEPFIYAARNIALSPFYMLMAMIAILFIAYLFAMIMEFFLMKLDLYRENPYARVPLVITDDQDYDPSLHETVPGGDHNLESRSSFYGMATAGMNYVSGRDLFAEELMGGKNITNRTGIEMGLTNQKDPLKNGDVEEDEGTLEEHGRRNTFIEM